MELIKYKKTNNIIQKMPLSEIRRLTDSFDWDLIKHMCYAEEFTEDTIIDFKITPTFFNGELQL